MPILARLLRKHMKNFGLLIIAVGILAAGCGSKTDTTVDGGTTGSSGSSKMGSDKGGTTDAGGVTEADLGVGFYPGSTDKPTGMAKVDGSEGTNFVSTRTTTDAIDKVVAFYKDAITKAGYQVAGGDANGIGGMKGKGTITVSVSKNDPDPGNLITVTVFKPKG
jgi:hypothetical protein